MRPDTIYGTGLFLGGSVCRSGDNCGMAHAYWKDTVPASQEELHGSRYVGQGSSRQALRESCFSGIGNRFGSKVRSAAKMQQRDMSICRNLCVAGPKRPFSSVGETARGGSFDATYGTGNACLHGCACPIRLKPSRNVVDWF